MNEIKSTHNIRLNNQILKKISNDDKFENLVNKIENILAKFSKNYEIEFMVDFSVKKDWEEPKDNKFILKIDFEGLSFREELKMWKEINDLIFQEINHLLTVHKKYSNFYHNFKNRFFIELAL